MQEEKADLCIPKAFALVLHYVGLESAVEDTNANFHSRNTPQNVVFFRQFHLKS